MSFPGDSVVTNLPVNAEDVGLIPGLGRSPGEGNGNPLQDSCLGNPMARGAWGRHKRVGHDLVTKQQFPQEELEFFRQEINCFSKKVMEVHYNCTFNRRNLEQCLA